MKRVKRCFRAAGRKIVLVFMCAALFLTAIPLAACDGKEGVNAAVWTARGTEKIIRDTDYSSRHTEKEIFFHAFRNEYENAQIIITAKKDISSYSLTLGDLVSDGGDKLSKENFTVYNEKYIHVEVTKDPLALTGSGYYPDALLPFEKAEEYGENTVKAGSNQGIWISLKVPEDQKADIYKGVFTVDADGEKYEVAVQAEIYDYTLDEEVRSKSSFGLSWQQVAVGEMDSSVEMQKAYYEFFLEYRLSPGGFPGMQNEIWITGEDYSVFDKWIEQAAIYAADPRCSNYHLPYQRDYGQVNEEGKSVQCVDLEVMRVLLEKMLDYSKEHNVNLFKKAGTYFVFFDEYDVNGTVSFANYTLKTTAELYRATAEEYAAKWGGYDNLSPFLKEVLDDLENLKNKCVGSLSEDLTEKCVLVPLVDHLDSESSRASYAEWARSWYGDGYETWTYTCLNPKAPNPTYHLEDELLSSRLLNWMMYDYDITGNLYWSSVLNMYNDGYVSDGILTDFYGEALRFANSNGDGFLMYIGREYGIFGPIGTVRLQSIRDGAEDYDLFYALEEFYKRNASLKGEIYDGGGFERIFDLVARDLYNGTLCLYEDGYLDRFDASRALLADLLELAENTGTVIEDFTVDRGRADIRISAPKDVVLTYDADLVRSEERNGISTYELSMDMNGAENYLSLYAESEEGRYGVRLYLGGRSVQYDFASLYESGEISVEHVSDGSHSVREIIVEGETLKALVMHYDVDENEELQYATIDVSKLKIDEAYQSIYLDVYANEKTEINILGRCVRGASKNAASVTLNEGINRIAIDTSVFNMLADGRLEKLIFTSAEIDEENEFCLVDLQLVG